MRRGLSGHLPRLREFLHDFVRGGASWGHVGQGWVRSLIKLQRDFQLAEKTPHFP